MPYKWKQGHIMDVFEAIKSRRSIRTYESEPVPEDKINKMLEAAKLAPSASNRQNWEFIILNDVEIKNQLVKACNKAFVPTASFIIACVVDDDSSCFYRAKN